MLAPYKARSALSSVCSSFAVPSRTVQTRFIIGAYMRTRNCRTVLRINLSGF